MKNDLKKKFLDILFEPIDEEEIVVESELTDVIKPKTEVKTVNKIPSADVTPNEVKKEVKASSFINIDVPKIKKEEPKSILNVLEEEFILDNNVSPIFGLDKKKQTPHPAQPKQVEKTVSQTYQEFTGQVISPIFGLDNSKANDARVSFNEGETVKEPKEVNTDVTDELELFDTDLEEVKLYEEPISLFDEPFDLPKVNEEVFNEPFTAEMKIINEEEPISLFEQVEMEEMPQEETSLEVQPEEETKEDDYAFEELDKEEDDSDIDVEFYEIKDEDVIPQDLDNGFKQLQSFEETEEYKTADLLEIKKELLSNLKETATKEDNILEVEIEDFDYDELSDQTRDNLFDDLLGD